MSGRNYVAEMRSVIDSEAQPTDAAPVVAARIVEKLRATDPELLAGWLDANAVTFVREAITAIDRSSRANVRATSGRAEFAGAIDAGDVAGWLSDRIRYVVNDANDRRPLRLMARADLLFVATSYATDARESLLEEAFFRALAKKVRGGTVSDHFTESEVQRLRDSITGTTPKAA